MSKTRFGHASAFGVIAAFAAMVVGLLVYLASLPEALNNISFVSTVLIFCIAAKKWREQNGGFLTFGQTYGYLIIVTIAYAVLITIWTYVFTFIIAPGFMDDKMALMELEFEEKGMSQAQIDMAMSWTRKMFSPAFMVTMALVGSIIMYGVINLIIAAIMKKDPPPHQFMPPTDGPFPGSNPNFPPQQ